MITEGFVLLSYRVFRDLPRECSSVLLVCEAHEGRTSRMVRNDEHLPVKRALKKNATYFNSSR